MQIPRLSRPSTRSAEQEAQRAEDAAAQAAADFDRLLQPGAFEELLKCYCDAPIVNAILAGAITNEAELQQALEAAGEPPD